MSRHAESHADTLIARYGDAKKALEKALEKQLDAYFLVNGDIPFWSKVVKELTARVC